MSAFGVNSGRGLGIAECPLMTQSGHREPTKACDSQPAPMIAFGQRDRMPCQKIGDASKRHFWLV
jgi:hypothetical protein